MDAKEFLERCLKDMAEKQGTDLHIKARHPSRVRMQKNLTETLDYQADQGTLEEILEDMLNSEQKDQLARTKSVDFAFNHPQYGRFRVNAFYQKGEISLAIRAVRNQIRTFEELGLPASLRTVAAQERGLVLVSGPVGTGKSTTVAAVIDHINKNRYARIITLEDPIEYLFKDNKAYISQREVGLDTDSFQSSLRGIVRQDPDVIMVGEIRDSDTLGAALACAETGRLVISTIHAKSVAQTFERVLGFFPHNNHEKVLMELSYALKAVVSQRLLRHSQTKDLSLACEVLLVNATAAKMIREGKLEKLNQVMQMGKEEGMQTLNMSLLELFNNGKIGRQEALSASDDPDALEMNLRGIFFSESKGGIIGS